MGALYYSSALLCRIKDERKEELLIEFFGSRETWNEVAFGTIVRA